MATPQKSDRICIIGAGPGGLSSAFFLNERGYQNVTVLEKSELVGGKARSWWVDGTPIDLGALDVGRNYRRVRALAKLVGQPLVRTAKLGMMDPRTGVAASKLDRLTRGVGKLRLAWMMLKYLYLTGIRYANYLEQPGMQNVPPALTPPLSDWLHSHGMDDLRPMFDYICTNFGYGPVDVIPAAYLLRFIDFGNMLEMLSVDLGFRSWPRNFHEGYQSLWEGVAGQLPDVRLGVEIEGVTRHPDEADPVQVRIAGKSEPLGFEHVIIACCLDPSIGNLVRDLEEKQLALFCSIKTQPYSTTVCRIHGLPRISLGAIPLPPQGHTYCFIKNWDQGEGAAFYIMNRDGLTDEQLFANLRSDMASLSTLDGEKIEVRVNEIVHHENWKYFPHVLTDDLAAGFYDSFERMQGDNATYFTGGLLGFETVGCTMRYSEGLVQRFFSV